MTGNAPHGKPSAPLSLADCIVRYKHLPLGHGLPSCSPSKSISLPAFLATLQPERKNWLQRLWLTVRGKPSSLIK